MASASLKIFTCLLWGVKSARPKETFPKYMLDIAKLEFVVQLVPKPMPLWWWWSETSYHVTPTALSCIVLGWRLVCDNWKKVLF